jgi:photosystem II stability/assembly factor-like uncharacterized protein
MAHHFTSGEGALWVQRDGPNTIPVYLGCHQLNDVDKPEGDVELIFCPDPSGPNRFETVGSLQGAAGAITSSVVTDITDEIDELERAKCPFTLFVHLSERGRRDVFSNFDRTYVYTNVRITNRGKSNLTARTPEDNARSEQTFDISAEAELTLKEPSINRQTQADIGNFNDITFCNDEACRTDRDPATSVCQTGFAVTDAQAGSPAGQPNVMVTTNGGTWAATSADPFATSENIIAVECFQLGRDTIRVVVARGTADGAAPAEIAYSDDSGATWTTVNVGSTNGEYAPARFSLFALDRNLIIFGSHEGRIYKSADACLTWTLIEDQGIHSGAWNAVRFVDDNVGWAVGASNIVARTIDGGTSWAAVTGPNVGAAAISLEVLDRNRAWVGYDDGELYYTIDGGTTWTQRSFTGSGVGQVKDVKFFNDSLGFLLTDNASPVGAVHWTIDGGFTWSTLTTPTNVGLNSLFICDEWTFFLCGEAQGGTGFIAKGAV